MKRIVLLFLTISIGFSPIGCQKYKPQKSTELESTPIATLRCEKESYKVNYELFRMLFLSAKEVVSGGDLSKFEGDEKDALLSKARSVALDRIYEIYSVLALCDKIGIDLYSRTVDKKVEESIELSVEGGYTETGALIEGTGSYEKYLESLKLFYANYAAQDLMIRYSYGVSAIASYYRGTYNDHGILSEEGALSYTDEDVTAYYNSTETRRILLAFTQKSEAETKALCDRISELASESDVSILMIGQSLGNDSDALYGHVIAKNSWNNSNYAYLTEAAFALAEGEVTMVAGRSGGYDGYFILYHARKSAENLAQNREKTEALFVENEIGKRYAEVKDALVNGTEFTDFYHRLSLANISMNEEEK